MKPPPTTDTPFRWQPDGTPVERLDERLPERTPGTVKKAAWLAVLEWVVLIVAALTVAVLIRTFLFQAFYIPSESMVPTLKIHDRVIVNKLSYRLHPVHRGDIVVFKTPEGVDPSIKDLIKRVVGLPGERIEGRADGHVYVDGKVLAEPYLPKGLRTDPFPLERIPKDSYWVMGDNRPNSKDSRYFPEHFIKRGDIVGRAFVRVWPLDRIGLL